MHCRPGVGVWQSESVCGMHMVYWPTWQGSAQSLLKQVVNADLRGLHSITCCSLVWDGLLQAYCQSGPVLPRALSVDYCMCPAALCLQGAGPQACLLHVHGVPDGPLTAQHPIQPGHQGPIRRSAAAAVCMQSQPHLHLWTERQQLQQRRRRHSNTL
jgi:hypothetical protein